ncbi:MAG: hypothetical protein IJK85_10630 [Bacteroidales bacterium]|nr:hypothetical protein [Bacteroidales bacterium]
MAIEKDTDFSTFKDLYASDKIEFDLLLTDPAFHFTYNTIVWLLVKLGLKKIALLKPSDNKNFEWIVKCPYCHMTYYQKQQTKKYKCPNCKKKSSIITDRGTLTSLLIKKINNPIEDNLQRYI